MNTVEKKCIHRRLTPSEEELIEHIRNMKTIGVCACYYALTIYKGLAEQDVKEFAEKLKKAT